MNKAYLEWRAPLLVNSNWWLAFHDDPLIPTSALSGETNNNRAGTTFWQIRRSAWLTHRMLQFKENVAETYVPPAIFFKKDTKEVLTVKRHRQQLHVCYLNRCLPTY